MRITNSAIRFIAFLKKIRGNLGFFIESKNLSCQSSLDTKHFKAIIPTGWPVGYHNALVPHTFED
jgi:hypothetical protein